MQSITKPLTEPLTKPLTEPAKFSSLPVDCLKAVFAHTSLFDITRCTMVGKDLRTIIFNNNLIPNDVSWQEGSKKVIEFLEKNKFKHILDCKSQPVMGSIKRAWPLKTALWKLNGQNRLDMLTLLIERGGMFVSDKPSKNNTNEALTYSPSLLPEALEQGLNDLLKDLEIDGREDYISLDTFNGLNMSQFKRNDDGEIYSPKVKLKRGQNIISDFWTIIRAKFGDNINEIVKYIQDNKENEDIAKFGLFNSAPSTPPSAKREIKEFIYRLVKPTFKLNIDEKKQLIGFLIDKFGIEKREIKEFIYCLVKPTFKLNIDEKKQLIDFLIGKCGIEDLGAPLLNGRYNIIQQLANNANNSEDFKMMLDFIIEKIGKDQYKKLYEDNSLGIKAENLAGRYNNVFLKRLSLVS